MSGFLKVKYCFTLSAVLVLAGCNTLSGLNTPNGTRQTDTPVQDVKNVQNTNVSLQAPKKELSPLDLHMKARKQVNPNDLSKIHDYALNAKKGIMDGILAPKPQRKPMFTQENIVTASSSIPIQASNLEKQNTRNFAPLSFLSRLAGARGESVNAPRRSNTRYASVKKKLSSENPSMSQSFKGNTRIKNLRVGEHANKTRIVLDLDQAALFQARLNTTKNILYIEIPDGIWDTQTEQVFDTHPLILAYMAKPLHNGGTRLAIRLRSNVELLMSAAFPQNANKPHRLVFDIAQK